MSPISVLIPTYRPGPYLREAAASVLAQEDVDLELIVVDDASPDPAAAVLAGLEDPRLRLVRNPVNLGLVGNWNRCLELATGDPILIFHHDDRLRPGYLARACAVLREQPEVGFVFSNVTVIDEHGIEQGGHWTPEALPNSDSFLTGSDLVGKLLASGNFIPCQTVVARRAAYLEAGPFNPELGYTPDLEMWLRLAMRWNAAYLADCWVELRRHQGQESQRFLGSAREIIEVRGAFHSYFRAAEVADVPVSSTHLHLARRHLQRWARASLHDALRRRQWHRATQLMNAVAKVHILPVFGSPC